MKLNLKIKQLNPDRTTYKKYGVMYEPDGFVGVVIDIPLEYVEKYDNAAPDDWIHEWVSLNEDGLKWLVGKLASLVDDIEDAHIENIKHERI